VSLVVTVNEAALLEEISEIASSQIDGDRHYLTAYNGETWNGGFDLPFCRTRFLNHDMEWPFRDLAYADMMETVDRFDTGDERDLVGVYGQLIGKATCDPFEAARNLWTHTRPLSGSHYSSTTLPTYNGQESWHCWRGSSFPRAISG